MGSLERKMHRNSVKKSLKETSINGLVKTNAIVAEKRAREIAAESIKTALEYIALALEGSLREEHKFGEKRLMKFMQQMNERLPDYLAFDDVPVREKMDKERLYDVTELLLELSCNDKCRMRKDFTKCSLYHALDSRNIPKYQEAQDICPYCVIPGEKLNERQIWELKMKIKDKLIERLSK